MMELALAVESHYYVQLTRYTKENENAVDPFPYHLSSTEDDLF